MRRNQRIRFAIHRSGMNQNELSKLLGVSRQAVNKYVNGQANPGDEVLQKLANLTGISFDWLKGGMKETEPKGFQKFISSEGLTRDELQKKVADQETELEKRALKIKEQKREIDLLNMVVKAKMEA